MTQSKKSLYRTVQKKKTVTLSQKDRAMAYLSATSMVAMTVQKKAEVKQRE